MGPAELEVVADALLDQIVAGEAAELLPFDAREPANDDAPAGSSAPRVVRYRRAEETLDAAARVFGALARCASNSVAARWYAAQGERLTERASLLHAARSAEGAR